MLLKTIVHTFASLLLCSLLSAQQNPFYNFQTDDKILKKNWVQSVQNVKKSWLSQVTPSLKKDYQEIYKTHFEQIEKTITGKSCITAKESHSYLQQVLSNLLSNELTFSQNFFLCNLQSNAP